MIALILAAALHAAPDPRCAVRGQGNTVQGNVGACMSVDGNGNRIEDSVALPRERDAGADLVTVLHPGPGETYLVEHVGSIEHCWRLAEDRGAWATTAVLYTCQRVTVPGPPK